MRTKKGFTLIELIIVMAIMGILVGVLIPSWGYYLQRSKTRTQNNKAKAIFNAAQTVVTDLNFSERRYLEAYSALPSGTSAEKTNILGHLYSNIPDKDTTTEWFYYWDGNQGYRCDKDGEKLTKDSSGYGSDFTSLAIAEWDEKIGNAIKRIVDDDMVYKFYVKDYKVQSVASARYDKDKFIGAYPISLDKVDEYGKYDADDLRDIRVQEQDMTYFDLDIDDIKP